MDAGVGAGLVAELDRGVVGLARAEGRDAGTGGLHLGSADKAVHGGPAILEKTFGDLGLALPVARGELSARGGAATGANQEQRR